MLGLGYSPLIFDVHFLCTCVNTVQANEVYVHLTECALFSRAGLTCKFAVMTSVFLQLLIQRCFPSIIEKM